MGAELTRDWSMPTPRASAPPLRTCVPAGQRRFPTLSVFGGLSTILFREVSQAMGADPAVRAEGTAPSVDSAMSVPVSESSMTLRALMVPVPTCALDVMISAASAVPLMATTRASTANDHGGGGAAGDEAGHRLPPGGVVGESRTLAGPGGDVTGGAPC